MALSVPVPEPWCWSCRLPGSAPWHSYMEQSNVSPVLSPLLRLRKVCYSGLLLPGGHFSTTVSAHEPHTPSHDKKTHVHTHRERERERERVVGGGAGALMIESVKKKPK